MPKAIFDWIEGGSFSESTVRANSADFAKLHFRQRALVDVSARSAETTLLGQKSALPVAIAPTGLSGVICPRTGEIAAARAALAEGIPYCLAMLSVCPLEEVAADAGPVWLQIAMLKRRDLIKGLIDRAIDAQCPVLVLTTTMPIGSRLTRSIYNNLIALPPPLSARTLIDYASRPQWLWEILTGRTIGLGNFAGAFTPGDELTEIMAEFDDSASWAEFEWIRKLWPGKLLVKGITNSADAEAAVTRGADGVSVSNHGGIQLDGAPSTITMLSSVVEAVADRAEVYLDGGVRSGQDVLKAMGLGATGCLIGRAHLYGLAASGEAGVRRAIDLIREEIDITMALTGTSHLRGDMSSILYDEYPGPRKVSRNGNEWRPAVR